MSYSRQASYSRSPSPYERRRRSSRSRSSDSSDAENPGNSLYVTGISTRVTKRELEKHFSTEGKVEDVNLVVDPLTRESRGFGFVTMSNLKEADRCIKYLDGSVLEGRVITVEKARRRRGRTPTPGRYLGPRTSHAHRRSRSYSPYSYRRDRSRSRSYSPYYYRRRRSRSLSYSRGRSYSRSRSPSYYSRDYSPDYRNYRRRSYRSITPPRRYRRYSRKSYSPSVSPGRSRSYSRSGSTPRYSRRRDYSRSKGFTKRSASPETSCDSRSSRSHTRSPSVSSTSRSESIRSRRYPSP